MLVDRTANGVVNKIVNRDIAQGLGLDECRSTITVILQIDRIYVRESAVLFSN